jgi:hypothetical protein
MTARGALLWSVFEMAAWSGAAEPSPPQEQAAPMVQELEIGELTARPPRGKVQQPTEITSAEKLAEALPDAKAVERLRGQVDFTTHKLLLFSWSGSGQDQLASDVTASEQGVQVTFRYRRGRTRDLRAHLRLFTLPAAAEWQVAGRNKRPE